VNVQTIESTPFGDPYRNAADQIARRFSGNGPLDKLLYTTVKAIGYTEGALADLGHIILPLSEPTYITTFSDGSILVELGSPTTGDLAQLPLGLALGLSPTPGRSAPSSIAHEARGGTYILRDVETGQVMRSGRTNDLLRRQAEHARDPLFKDFDFEPVHRTDCYATQRGLEQELDWIHNPPLNYNRPIDPRNPNLFDYLRAANGYLDGQ
jgi:hypothetical protein